MIEYTDESDLNTFPLNDQEKLLTAGTDSASHTRCTVSPVLPNCTSECNVTEEKSVVKASPEADRNLRLSLRAQVVGQEDFQIFELSTINSPEVSQRFIIRMITACQTIGEELGITFEKVLSENCNK